jgi:uncharacterized SAM-binding protein YcdF (DUF218 family)
VAVRDFLDSFAQNPEPVEANLIVLAGNAIIPTIEGALDLAKCRRLPLVVSGGIGHSTVFLENAVNSHRKYSRLSVSDRSEAEIIRDIALEFWGFRPGDVLAETASTNCGENVRFTRCLLREMHIHPPNIVLVQDPLMQRRTDASFRRHILWVGKGTKALLTERHVSSHWIIRLVLKLPKIS